MTTINHIFTDDPDFVRRRQKLRSYYITARGSDVVAGVAIPRTTNADVKQLATLWAHEVNKVSPKDADDRRHLVRWAACMNRVAAAADPNAMGSPYPHNSEFWQECTRRTAIWLNARKVVPSKWTLALDATVESLKELPDAIGGAGRYAGGKVGGAFGWIGDKLGDASTAVKWTLILGGAALTAAVVVPPIVRAVRR